MTMVLILTVITITFTGKDQFAKTCAQTDIGVALLQLLYDKIHPGRDRAGFYSAEELAEIGTFNRKPATKDEDCRNSSDYEYSGGKSSVSRQATLPDETSAEPAPQPVNNLPLHYSEDVSDPLYDNLGSNQYAEHSADTPLKLNNIEDVTSAMSTNVDDSNGIIPPAALATSVSNDAVASAAHTDTNVFTTIAAVAQTVAAPVKLHTNDTEANNICSSEMSGSANSEAIVAIDPTKSTTHGNSNSLIRDSPEPRLPSKLYGDNNIDKR